MAGAAANATPPRTTTRDARARHARNFENRFNTTPAPQQSIEAGADTRQTLMAHDHQGPISTYFTLHPPILP